MSSGQGQIRKHLEINSPKKMFGIRNIFLTVWGNGSEQISTQGFEPLIWLEIITSCDDQSACFKGLRRHVMR